MATGIKTGLNPARTLGNQPDNKGFSEYSVASGYATSLFTGDIVKLGTSGTIEQAAAGDDAIGVFLGCSYTNSEGTPVQKPYWPASTVASDAKAKVMDLEGATFLAKANAAVTSVNPGDLFGLVIGSGSTATGRSAALVDVASDVVLIGAAHVKVISVVDADNLVLEVAIANHEFRDNG